MSRSLSIRRNATFTHGSSFGNSGAWMRTSGGVRTPVACRSESPPTVCKEPEVEFFDRLETVRERWNVLDHTFYRRWSAGELSRDELAFYAGEYRHAVVALAEGVRATGEAEHAAEEEAHIELWD